MLIADCGPLLVNGCKGECCRYSRFSRRPSRRFPPETDCGRYYRHIARLLDGLPSYTKSMASFTGVAPSAHHFGRDILFLSLASLLVLGISPRATIKRTRTFGTSKASEGNVEFFEGEYTCASCCIVLYQSELILPGIRFGRSPRGTTLCAVAVDNFGMPNFNATENTTSALASEAQTTRCADSFCEAT